MSKTARKLSKKANADLESCFREAKQMVDDNRLQEAKNLCEKLLASYGDSKDILNLMGVIHYRGGDPNTAIAYFKRLLDDDPTNTEALWNLANLLMNLGFRPQAVEMYESILTHDPEHFMALKQLNKLYAEDARWPEVFITSRKILTKEAWHDDVWPRINDAVSKVPHTMLTEEFRKELHDLLHNPSNNPLQVIKLTLSTICFCYPLFNATASAVNRGGIDALEPVPMAELGAMLDIPLLHTVLRLDTVPHPSLEKLMTLARRKLLLLPEGETLEPYYPLLLTLASQSYVNEYVYFQSEEEKAQAAMLRDGLSASALQPDQATICKLLLLGSYEPLSSFAFSSQLIDLAKRFKDADFSEFVTQTVAEILEERAIIPTIETLGTIDDDISQAVQGQYEQNPYPRWIDYGDFPSETMETVLRRLYPSFDITNIELTTAPEILIAGCGTGKHAVGTAQRFGNSKMIAVDLSRASLAYAIRKSREYSFKNIHYYQADILKLGVLNRTFDIVESAGVLHHMRDPMEGWKVITDLLKPGGLMKIGLYSAKAREAITAMRQEIKDKGYGDSPDEIRRFRRDMMQDVEMITRYPFTASNDFYGLSECRDLLFHRQEHCTSIPEIRERLHQLGLKFIGFEVATPSIFLSYLEKFPADKAMSNLDNWHKYEQENPYTFFGMYQFWCYKPL